MIKRVSRKSKIIEPINTFINMTEMKTLSLTSDQNFSFPLILCIF